MDKNTIDGFFTLVAVLLAAIAFLGTIIRLAMMEGSTLKRIAIGLAFFAIWAAAQMGAFLLVLTLSYCENCSGKPFTLHDLLMYLVLVAPSFMAFGAFLLLSFVNRKKSLEDKVPGSS